MGRNEERRILAFFLLFVGFVQPLVINSFIFKPAITEDGFRKALNAKLMFIGLKNLVDQTGSAIYFRLRNGLKYANVMNDNSINAERSTLPATNLCSLAWRFPYYLETLCLYFEKFARTSILPADFCTNTDKYGQVGMSGVRTWAAMRNVQLGHGQQ